MVISKEQWVDWKRNPVTQAYLQILLENRGNRLSEIGEGAELETNKLYMEIGRTQGIRDSFLLATKDFPYMELEDGTESSGLPSNS